MLPPGEPEVNDFNVVAAPVHAHDILRLEVQVDYASRVHVLQT